MLNELDRHLQHFAFDVPVDVRVHSSYAQVSRYVSPDGRTIVGDFSAVHRVAIFPLGNQPIYLTNIPVTYTAPLCDIQVITGELVPIPRAVLELQQLGIGRDVAERLHSEVEPTVNGFSLEELAERVEGLQALLT